MRVRGSGFRVWSFGAECRSVYPTDGAANGKEPTNFNGNRAFVGGILHDDPYHFEAYLRDTVTKSHKESSNPLHIIDAERTYKECNRTCQLLHHGFRLTA